MKRARRYQFLHAALLFCAALAPPAWAATFFVRTDGGSRYDATHAPTGQCDGQADVAYPGSGVNQHCAFNDVRFLWDTADGGHLPTWALNGGDTAVVRVKSGGWRIGWDTASGPGPANFCNYGSSPVYGCGMPPPPSGTSGAHTRILSGCAYDGNCTPMLAGYPVPTNNLTQLFGGYGASGTLWFRGSSYIDVAGFEVTTHNGACSPTGAPNYPTACSNSPPYSDYSEWGLNFDNTTHDIALTDLYVHGFGSLGLAGQLGGKFTLTRVVIAFNAFAGWNMDDGTAPPTSAQLLQSNVTMFGNGCLEEYPIVHTQFPAKACWDSNSGGFGDSWSEGPTSGSQNADTFTCDHCLVAYNTKDGSSGPHTVWKHLSVTNTLWYGNMGQQGKWAVQAGGDELIQNDLALGDCNHMSVALPGAAQNFNITTGLGGSYLSNFCRAGGNIWDDFSDTGAVALFSNNTFVGYNPTFFEIGCITTGTCSYTFKNNIFLGYTTTSSNYPFSGQAPGLYLFDGGSVTPVVSNNIEYGIRNGDTCGGTIICTDPFLTGEPAQGTWPPDSVLDAILTGGWYPCAIEAGSCLGASPAIGAGTPISGLTMDYYGVTRPNPPSIGAVEPAGAPSGGGGLGGGASVGGGAEIGELKININLTGRVE